MKKLASVLLCLILLASCVLSASAAGGVPEAVMDATKSVVRITSQYKRGSVSGSGFIIQNVPGDVLIVTNDHVVEDNPQSISVWIGQNTLVFAEIICTTSERDLCVLRVTDTVQLPALTLSTEEPVHGAAIYAVGYPGAGDVLSDSEAHTSDSATITNGIVSAIRSFTIEKGGRSVGLLQINAAINPGNSGGPLFNEAGEVIGINTYKVTGDSQGIFGSVAVAELWDFLEENYIELQVEEEPEETTEVTEETTVPTEAPEEPAPAIPPVYLYIGGGALVCAVILLIVIAAKAKKKRRQAPEQEETGTSLTQYLQNYPQGMPLGNAVRLLLPIAIQLRNMHNEGRLHLQVNPENILLVHGEARLKEPTAAETGRYCSGFTAPEIYRGVGYGILSDVYSFGAVLYYAATGLIPANSLQPEKLEENLSSLSHEGFAQLLRRCLAQESSDRFQHMQELIFSIAGYNIPVAERAEETAGESVPQAKPRKKSILIWLLVLFVLAALCVGSIFLLQNSGILPTSDDTPGLQEYLQSEGAPTGEVREMECSAAGNVTASALTFQTMDDGYVRFTLTYQAPEGRAISIFSPPEGDLFSYDVSEPVAAGENTLVFDLPEAHAVPGQSVTVGFHSFDSNDDFVCFVCGEEQVEQPTEPPLTPYEQAEALLAAGDKFGAAKAFYAIGDNPEARARCFAIWDEIAVRHTIATGAFHSLGVRTDGTVAVAGNCLDFYNCYMPVGQRQTEVGDWSKVVAVSADEYLSVGLRSDGTVLAAGDNSNGQYNVGTWRDIVAIDTDGWSITGLKADGTVLTTSDKLRPIVSQWTDIIAISGNMGLKADGTVVCTESSNPYAGWKDIVAISEGMGLRSDGTVVLPGNHWQNQEVSQWRDIVAIFDGCTGIREDGTMVSFGSLYEEGFPDLTKWTDMAAVSMNIRHIIGLKKDGTMIGYGNNFTGRITGTYKWDSIRIPD